ncbi:hypothetical protein TraAM80_06746 [Trypanosoma rangeli]|uniref:Uncharacterized protein n=1 Tax=Trypanosoma rangeli TaxID=5698 RepID=A0A422N935_TRYRA|nr:uncharacterized protein TraAM80_06746 [Trypanosoma rangeli]RNF01942.1 hypothetical protein TraAM80_06746 [Trypanosoma rangeli]|eukprot:RNF01942.1 hypothetical protein TraAM80_06746 [Trypanosoma rangeli]
MQQCATEGEKVTIDESSEFVVISKNDCNHMRYIIALAERRLQNYKRAESICMEILASDHSNCDALESLIELYTGTERPDKLRELFDKIQVWTNKEEMKPNQTEKAVKV